MRHHASNQTLKETSWLLYNFVWPAGIRASAIYCHGHWPRILCCSETPWSIKKVKEGCWGWPSFQQLVMAALDTGWGCSWGWQKTKEPWRAGPWVGSATTVYSTQTLWPSRYCPGQFKFYGYSTCTYILKLKCLFNVLNFSSLFCKLKLASPRGA